MPTHDHEQPPPDNSTPPAAAYRDAWLNEMWAPVREFVPAHEPAKKARKGRKKRSTEMGAESPSISTGCAETGLTEMTEGAA